MPIVPITDEINRSNMKQDGQTASTFKAEIARQKVKLKDEGSFEAQTVIMLLNELLDDNASDELILSSLEAVESFCRIVREELGKVPKM